MVHLEMSCKTFAGLEPNHIVSLDLPEEKAIEKFTSPIIIIDPIDSNRNLGLQFQQSVLQNLF